MDHVTQTDAETPEPGQTLGGHHHRHGRPVSWVLIAVIIAAFCAGAAAIIADWWWLFWTAAGIVALSVPAGWLAGIMKDTVVADPGPRRRLPGEAADPGVRLE